MLRRPQNALIRVAAFPVLLLFWQYVFGTDLPLLAPAMCAVFLTTTHEPPPLLMVILMGIVLAATAWVQGVLSIMLADYSLVYYSALFGVFFWCMYRTSENPQDLLAILLIVSTAMVAVFAKQKGIDVSSIPYALIKNIFIAGFVAYLAYFLFPGGEPLGEIGSGTGAPAPPQEQVWQLLVKALAVMFTLIVAIETNMEQATIITVVVALIIKDPDPQVGHQYGIRRALTTYGSLIYALPALGLSLLEASTFAILGFALVFSLFMGIHAIKKKASYNAVQLLYTSYVVLVYYGLTTYGFGAINEDLVRFGSILLAALLGVMVLVIIQPKRG
ncbi:DUF2955 domain-containing protein [Enterovibrio paralichthyis]|uniref:DUF2955 domain-containing protein n=1 Tax=Enterovibrio paralichthyis TaxID=2853805 RepID=UPI001C48C7F2|nr:DUF2955 domain-containing protein [Enterovibrio paralichthyis]MBV7300718.1 DUF2955 domain-containing protein [Enterovibrio paralichthyis]